MTVRQMRKVSGQHYWEPPVNESSRSDAHDVHHIARHADTVQVGPFLRSSQGHECTKDYRYEEEQWYQRERHARQPTAPGTQFRLRGEGFHQESIVSKQSMSLSLGLIRRLTTGDSILDQL